MSEILTKALSAVMSLALVFISGVPANAGTPNFPDVKAGSWYENDVKELAAKGLINGCGDGRFHPGDTITAAQFVTIVARCAGITGGPSSSGHWATPFMSAGLSRGWYDWDEIPPTGEKFEKPITRELSAKILMRALLPDKRGDYNTESAKMTDFSQLNGRYYESVLAGYSCGIFAGDDKGRFKPKSGLTRAEACALFARALATAGGSVQPPPETPVPTPAPAAGGAG